MAAGGQGASALKVIGVLVVCGLVLTGCIIGGAFDTDGGTAVPTPSADDARENAALLADASAAQGICFGWELSDRYGSRPVSAGSNLGVGTTVADQPDRCPRWMEVRATINYVPESSESPDYATIEVAGSDGLAGPAAVQALARLGLDEDAFLDDPAVTICRASQALSLIAAERDPEVATTPPAASGAVAALPPAGSDFWRDRWLYVLSAAGLLLVGLLVVMIGVVERRRHRQPGRR